MIEHHYMDEGLERWLFATANRNYWRVAKWYDLDDLIQDGYLCYHKCLKKYGQLRRKKRPQKDDRRNFMALVKRTYENHIHDLASRRTLQKERAVSQIHSLEDTADAWLERHGQVELAVCDLTVMIKQSPKEIQELLRLLTTEDTEFLQTKVRRCHKRIGKIMGLDPKVVDIADMVRQYFQVHTAR
jgi:hypothetical protein